MGSEVVRAFRRFTQTDRSALEAGGVLIGRHIVGTNDVVADLATTPTPGDRRRRTSFYRSSLHQEAMDEIWAESRGTLVYLGEWHTHPEPRPSPSSIDLRDWSRRLKNDVVEAQFAFFVIVGNAQTAVWEGNRLTFEILRLVASANDQHEDSSNE